MTKFTALISGILIAAGLSAPVHAQQALKPEESARLKVEVNTAMQAYIDAFNRNDSKFIGHVTKSNPSVTVGPRGVTTQTPDEVEKGFANSAESLAKAGWVKTETTRYDICVLNPTTAWFDGRFARMRKDGSVISQHAITYFFTKGSDGWKMFANFGHDINKVVTCKD